MPKVGSELALVFSQAIVYLIGISQNASRQVVEIVEAMVLLQVLDFNI